MADADGTLDVLVVGAGIVGLACARELRRQGLRVALVDAALPGSGATDAAAGMLSPVSEADLLPDAFATACCISRGMWRGYAAEIAEESGLDPGYDDSPTVVPAVGADDLEFLDRIQMAATRLGERCEELPLEELRRRLPGVRRGVARALVLPDEHRVDPRRVTHALVQSLGRRNVPVHAQHPVSRVEQLGDAVRISGPGWEIVAGRAVVTAGAWSGQVAGLPSLPVRPVRGQMIAYEGLEWRLDGCCRCRHFYALQRAEQLWVGATVEEVGFDVSTTAAARESLAGAAARLLPRLRGSVPAQQWAGLRPASPDGLPIVGEIARNVYVATGHFRNGILLAPWTAQVLSQLVTGSGEGPPAELSPRRFPSQPGAGSRSAKDDSVAHTLR